MHQSTIPQLAERDGRVEARVITASPEQAAEWLTRNPRNRTVSQATVNQYADDMLEGRWAFTGQPIIFNSAGNLDDGQHRLSAQVKAGVTIDWLVVGGVNHAAQDYMDIGRPRTVAGQLQIAGHTFGHAVAAAARLELMYRGNPNPSKPQTRAFAEANYRALATAGFAGRSTAQVIRGSSAAYSVAYLHIAEIAPDLVEEFFDMLRTGANLPSTSPLLVARNAIAKEGSARKNNDSARIRFVDYLHKTWNLWISGKSLKSFKAPSGPVGLVVPSEPAA